MKPITGFQKSQVLALQREEDRAKAKAEIPPLNPPFPYAVESWDPAWWNVPANPQPLES